MSQEAPWSAQWERCPGPEAAFQMHRDGCTPGTPRFSVSPHTPELSRHLEKRWTVVCGLPVICYPALGSLNRRESRKMFKLHVIFLSFEFVDTRFRPDIHEWRPPSIPLKGTWKRERGGKLPPKGTPESPGGTHRCAASWPCAAPGWTVLSALFHSGNRGSHKAWDQGTQGVKAASGLHPGLSDTKALARSHITVSKRQSDLWA